MKKIMFLLIPLFFLFIGLGSANAQTVEVKDCEEFMCLGTQAGMTVFVPEVSEKKLTKEWKRLMRKRDAKTTEWDENLFADDAEIPAIRSNPVDIYAKFEESKEKGGVQFSVFIYKEESKAFMCAKTDDELFNKAKKFVESFVQEVVAEHA